MTRIFCDRCGKETEVKDTKQLVMQNSDGKPFTPEMELCVNCALEIKDFVRHSEAVNVN